MPNIGFEIKRKCKVCGAVFIAKTLDSHYCSPKCGKVAWKRKKDAKAKDAKLETIAHHIPDIREYISVKEAVALFGVERTTLYRLIHTGRIPSINVGKRLTRIKRSDLEQLSTPDRKVSPSSQPLHRDCTVWNPRTVTPSTRYARSTTSTTVRCGRTSANTPSPHVR